MMETGSLRIDRAIQPDGIDSSTRLMLNYSRQYCILERKDNAIAIDIYSSCGNTEPFACAFHVDVPSRHTSDTMDVMDVVKIAGTGQNGSCHLTDLCIIQESKS